MAFAPRRVEQPGVRCGCRGSTDERRAAAFIVPRADSQGPRRCCRNGAHDGAAGGVGGIIREDVLANGRVVGMSSSCPFHKNQ
jgi:hypothetical protein